MNQTNNRIREEFLEWCKEDPALELANGVGSFENIADWFLPKIDELLKSQREELVEKIKEINEYHTDIGGRNVVFTDDYIRKEDIINYLSHSRKEWNKHKQI